MAKQQKDDGDSRSVEGPLFDVEADAAKASAEARAENVDKSELPKDLSVHDTLAWVGNDKTRAQVALDAENKGGGARNTLVTELNKLLTEQTGAGVRSNEA
jgi:hypothetical protein